MDDFNYSELELRHFAAIIESTDDAIIGKDLEGTITSWNPGATKLYGYTREEALGKNIAMLIPPERLDDEPEILSQIKQGKRIEHYETVRMAKDGTRIIIALTVSPIRNDKGEIIGASKIARDISSEKEAERHNAMLAAIIESSEDAIVSKTLQGIVTSWNPAAERIFGWKAHEMIGQHIIKIIPPDRLEEEPKIISRIQAGERVDHFDTIRMRKDGSLFNISLTISPIRAKDGKIIGASKIARDITDRKTYERSIEEKNLALEKINKELNDFAYIISHDLKAPLRAIGTLSYFIMEDYGPMLGEQGVEHLEMLVGRVKRMNNLIDAVLEYSRLGRGKERSTHVDVTQMVDDILASLTIPENIKVTYEKLPVIITEKVPFGQVIQNLLSNAIKFIDKSEGKIQIGYRDLGAFHEFCVSDNGPGIDKKYHDKIFQIFQTLQPRDEFESTGVGLTIVKKAVEMKGGQVWLTSVPGEGTTFYFTWPKHNNE
jgi:PAS domain S-box-containing protein